MEDRRRQVEEFAQEWAATEQPGAMAVNQGGSAGYRCIFI